MPAQTIMFSRTMYSVIAAIALLGGLSAAIDPDSMQIPIQQSVAGTYYHIRSVDSRYVQASGVLQPLKLVSSPNRNTVWYVADVGTSGYATSRSASGWHASAPGDGTPGPIIEDPNFATQWYETVVNSQFSTLRNRSRYYWTTHAGSDEIWLDKKKNGTSGTQAWRFLHATSITTDID